MEFVGLIVFFHFFFNFYRRCEIGMKQCPGYPLYICKMYGTSNTTNVCSHKNLFPNVSIYDILATFVIIELKENFFLNLFPIVLFHWIYASCSIRCW